MIYKKLFGFDFSVSVNELNLNEFFSRKEFVLEDKPKRISVEFKKISSIVGDIEIHIYEKGFYSSKKIVYNDFLYKLDLNNSNKLVLDFYFKNPFSIDRLEYIGDIIITSEEL